MCARVGWQHEEQSESERVPPVTRKVLTCGSMHAGSGVERLMSAVSGHAVSGIARSMHPSMVFFFFYFSAFCVCAGVCWQDEEQSESEPAPPAKRKVLLCGSTHAVSGDAISGGDT